MVMMARPNDLKILLESSLAAPLRTGIARSMMAPKTQTREMAVEEWAQRSLIEEKAF